MILVDSSIWIESFRKGTSLHLDQVVNLEEIVVCLPILQEVLQGFRDESAFRRAHEAMLAFPIVESPLTLNLYEEAIGLYRLSRRNGLTVRSSIDCLIAACAIKNDLILYHGDRDYPMIAKISPLRQKNISIK